MADTKISALIAATLPLSESDELALVQSANSRMVTVGQILDAVSLQGTDVGSISLLTNEYLIQFQTLQISGTNVLQAAGTALVVVTDFATVHSAMGPVVGSPKGGSFVVPDNYVQDLIRPLMLSGNDQVTLQGSAELVLTDDFGTRSKIVLAGVA